jgi:Flp pilus assembly protein TadD
MSVWKSKFVGISLIVGIFVISLLFYLLFFDQDDAELVGTPSPSPVVVAPLVLEQSSTVSSPAVSPISPISPVAALTSSSDSPILPTTSATPENPIPRDVMQYLWQGDELYGRGEYEEAIANYDRFLEQLPNVSDVHNNRGLAYFQLKRYEEAVTDFSKSIELGNSEPALPYYNRGLVYFAQDKFQLAIDDFSQAVTLNPEFAQAFNSRAVALSEQGQYESAIADFTVAIDLDHRYSAPYFGRGVAYKNLGEKSKARKDFEMFLELGHSNSYWKQQAQEHLTSLE